jgi:hypothetical protein
MPNYCYYKGKVIGRKENIDIFEEVLNNNHKRLMGRNFYAEFLEKRPLKDSDTYESYFTGECAWSVYGSLMGQDSPGVYTAKAMAEYREKKNKIKNDFIMGNIQLAEYETRTEKVEEETIVTCLERESRLLNLQIEIYSEEYGAGFEEHTLISQGEILDCSCKDMSAIHLDSFYSIEELNEELERNYTEKDFEDNDGMIKEGGFEKWIFL